MSREFRSENYRERKKRKSLRSENLRLGILAEWTGLEPATPGVTGRYSNQLNYHSFFSNARASSKWNEFYID